MYDEIGKMLGELDSISMLFRFAAPSNLLKVWFSENNNIYEIFRSQIPFQFQNSNSFKEVLSELKIPQNHQSQAKFKTLNPFQTNGQPFVRASQQVYRDQEQQMIQKNFMEKKNQIFFTQKKIQSIFCNQFQNINFYSIDLIDIPDVFLLLHERVPEEIQTLKKRQQKQNNLQYDEPINPSRHIVNEEKEEFIWLLANQLKQARKIESIRFRISQYKEEEEQEYLLYFALEKLFAFIILKILDSHSFNCQIKNLEISGEYGFQNAFTQSSQKNILKRSSEQFEDQQISNLLYSICFKFQSLQQISLTSIKLSKLDKFIEMCLNQNPNLRNVQFSNCSSSQISIDNEFFRMSSKLNQLNSLCLSENNMQIKDSESMFRLFAIIVLIENVDLSNNPLFLNEFIISEQDFDEQIQYLISKSQIDLFTISANGENLEQQFYPLQNLNLKNTLLGQSSINQINFLNIFTQCLADRKNQLSKIDLSQNYIGSIQYNGEYFQRLDKKQQKNVFQVIKDGSLQSKLQINLSCNYLTVGDLFSLIQAPKYLSLEEIESELKEQYNQDKKSLKLQIDISYNFVDMAQINDFCIKMAETASKYEIFSQFLIKEFIKQSQENGVKFIFSSALQEQDTFQKKKQVSQQNSFTKDKDEKKQNYNLKCLRQKIDQATQFLDSILFQYYNENQKQKQIFCDIMKTLGLLEDQQDLLTFLTKNQDQEQIKNFLNYISSQIVSEKKIQYIWNNVWTEQNYTLSMQLLQGIDLSDQNCNTQNDYLYSQIYKKNLGTHHCKIKVYKLLQAIIDIISQVQKQQIQISFVHAKYFLKIIDNLQKIYVEYSVYQRQYKYKLKFDLVVQGCPLIVLKLQNIQSGLHFKESSDQQVQKDKTQDIILKVIMQFLRITDNQDQEKKYYQREVQKLDEEYQDYKTSQIQMCLQELDFSRNTLSPYIVKYLSLLCQKAKTIKKLVLDETQLTLSGIVYLFMAFTDDENSIYQIKDLKSNLQDYDIESQNLVSKSLAELNASQKYQTEEQMEDNDYSIQYQKKLHQIRQLKERLQKNLTFDKENQNEQHQNILEHLSIKGNKINSAMMRRINYKLQKGLRIKELDLSDNFLGDSGVKHLCQYLGENQYIQKVFLNNNQISERGALKLIKFFDGSFKNIKSVSIAGNLKMKKIVEVCEKRAQLFNIKDYNNEGLIYI